MEAVLHRLEPLLGAPEGTPAPLEGGITNRNWRARLGSADYVVRVCSAGTEVLGIDRVSEHEATSRAAELGIGPPVAAWLPDDGVLVTRYLPGGPVAVERLREPALLRWIAGALRAFHAGPPLPARFHVPSLVRRQRVVVEQAGGEIPDVLGSALALGDRVDAAVDGLAEHEPVPCHNDLLTANFIADGGGENVRIVDWEYSGMNDRFFDLANLSVNNGFGEDDDGRLLEAYFSEPATPRRFAALRLMRLVSDLREAMWGVVQKAVSDLDIDYEAYAREHFERLEAAAADPRVEGWLEEVRG